MSQSLTHNLILAIKADELAIFADLIKGREDLAIGRFPILSICYMYGAKKIIKFYNELLLNITSYKSVEEEYDLYKQFASIAGKNLRLFVGDKAVVTPLEMMALMHRDGKCKKAYKLYKDNGYLTAKVIKNLNYIYSNHRQSPKINGDKFKIAFRPLSRIQKIYYRIAICFSLLLTMGFVGSYMFLNSTVGFGTALNPYKVYMQSQLISAIKSNSHVILTKDFSITEDLSNCEFSGSIDGDGHTLTIDNIGSQLLLANKGTIKDLNLVYGEISKTVNNNFSLLVDENSGKLNNINIVCDKLNIDCDKSMADMYISGFANNNTGLINGCTIKMICDVKTKANGDCYISGIAGKNTGEINDCVFEKDSSITTYEADISGICAKNEVDGKIIKSTNFAKLLQSSDTDEWSPNVAGISMNNYGEISQCKNYGDLKVESTNENEESKGGVFVGGISINNYGIHLSCLNDATLTAISKQLIIYCGGITAYNTYWDNKGVKTYGVIDKCGTDGIINASTENSLAICGGVSGYLYGEISNSYSLMEFENSSDEEKHFFGSMIGASNIQYSLFGSMIEIKTDNNYTLIQDNAKFHIGALINNGGIVKVGANITTGITMTTETDIKSQGVYWV